jgi:hypothetical protein
MPYSPQQKAALLAAGRQAIADAEATLAAPRPEIAWPVVPDKLTAWRKQVEEQEQRFARERAQPWPLTDYEQQSFAQAVAQQKDFNRKLLAHVVAGLREEYNKEFDAFATELAKRLGDLFAEELGPLMAEAIGERERQVRANNNKSGGEVIDLPWPLVMKRRAG